MRAVSDGDGAVCVQAIDDLVEGYVSWREECRGARLAYQRWADAEPAERGLAYAGFLAALDREEHAARIYGNHIERFSAPEIQLPLAAHDCTNFPEPADGPGSPKVKTEVSRHEHDR